MTITHVHSTATTYLTRSTTTVTNTSQTEQVSQPNELETNFRKRLARIKLIDRSQEQCTELFTPVQNLTQGKYHTHNFQSREQ